MYQDYYLKFTDEDQCNSILFTQETFSQGNFLQVFNKPKYAAVDVIGLIYTPSGNYITTVEGLFPEMNVLPGWHANVRHTEEAPELLAFTVNPTHPSRMWA